MPVLDKYSRCIHLEGFIMSTLDSIVLNAVVDLLYDLVIRVGHLIVGFYSLIVVQHALNSLALNLTQDAILWLCSVSLIITLASLDLLPYTVIDTGELSLLLLLRPQETDSYV